MSPKGPKAPRLFDGEIVVFPTLSCSASSFQYSPPSVNCTGPSKFDAYRAGPALACGLIFQGIARGSMMTVVVLVLMETRGVAAQSRGLAGGLFFSAAEIGGALGPLSVGILSDVTGGFAAALFLLTGVCAALMLLLARLWLLDR